MNLKRHACDSELSSTLGSAEKKSRVRDHFDVIPVSQFGGKFPHFRLPEEVGSFSLDASRKYVDSRTQLRVYSPPASGSRVAWDLRHGYDKFIKRNESVKEHLDHLLMWIQAHKAIEFKLPGSEHNDAEKIDANRGKYVDFVSWRGLLTTLLCTPFENREGWRIAVCRYRGTLYLCEFATEQKLCDNRMNDERQLEMSYWGFKFETYITAADSSAKPDSQSPVNNNQAFVTVVRTRLNKHTLLFGGEVDCCERTNDHRYVELKTSRLLYNNNQNNNFKRYKLIKWWAQSFLVGIPKIVCGFRDDDGVVRELKDFVTADLPKHCRDVRDAWNADVCFNFFDQFLQFVKDSVCNDYNESIYVFNWSPGKPVTYVVEPAESSDNAFLPSWYTTNAAATSDSTATCCSEAD